MQSIAAICLLLTISKVAFSISTVVFVAIRKTLGYEIVLVYIHLDIVSLNQARIAQRVQEGGHYVPEAKVISRLPGVLKNIQQTFPLCDHVYVLNNSYLKDPFQQLAVIKKGLVTVKKDPLPDWAYKMLTQYLG